MSDHQVVAPSPMAREPKQQRGRMRVAALMDAAAAVFAERGYDAATMTEIAARANTAIGSLYQFFSSKAALGEALVARYAERLQAGLELMERRAAQMTPPAIADGIIDMMLSLRADRASAIALIDAQDTDGAHRLAMRAKTMTQVITILHNARPALDDTKATAVSAIILQMMKSVPALEDAAATDGVPLVAEARTMLKLYLADALA